MLGYDHKPSWVGDPSTNARTIQSLSDEGTIRDWLSGAIFTYLKPRLAQDVKIDLARCLSGVTPQNYRAAIPTIVKRFNKACKGKLAQDRNIDNFPFLLNVLEGEMPQFGREAPAWNAPRNNGSSYGRQASSRENPDLVAAARDEENENEATMMHQGKQVNSQNRLSPEAVADCLHNMGKDESEIAAILEALFGNHENEDTEAQEVNERSQRPGTSMPGSTIEARNGAADDPMFPGAPQTGGTMQPGRNDITVGGMDTALDSFSMPEPGSAAAELSGYYVDATEYARQVIAKRQLAKALETKGLPTTLAMDAATAVKSVQAKQALYASTNLSDDQFLAELGVMCR